MEDPAKFDRLELQITPNGELARKLGPSLVGRYARR